MYIFMLGSYSWVGSEAKKALPCKWPSKVATSEQEAASYCSLAGDITTKAGFRGRLIESQRRGDLLAPKKLQPMHQRVFAWSVAYWTGDKLSSGTHVH